MEQKKITLLVRQQKRAALSYTERRAPTYFRMSKQDFPRRRKFPGMIGNNPREIVLRLQAVELRMVQMHRIAQQRHPALLKQGFTVGALFQRAGHNGPPALRKRLPGGAPRLRAAQLRIADKDDAPLLPAVKPNRRDGR